MVSGTISLPCSGFFSPFLHSTGSLSVSREYLALPDGPGRFTQNSSCSALLRIPLCFVSLRVRACHPLRTYFPEGSTHEISCNGAVLQLHICRNIGGLGSSPFARHYWGNHCLFSFPAGTKMFQFPALASRIAGCHPFRMTGCPIRKSADQRSFAPTRSLSQLITSFIASESQGIRHVPFLAFLPFPSKALRLRTAYTFSFNFTFSVTTCHRSSEYPRDRAAERIGCAYPFIPKWRITDSNR